MGVSGKDLIFEDSSKSGGHVMRIGSWFIMA